MSLVDSIVVALHFKRGKIFMEDNQCFCVALFEKKLEEVINFAVSFVHETKRVGAFIGRKNIRLFDDNN